MPITLIKMTPSQSLQKISRAMNYHRSLRPGCIRMALEYENLNAACLMLTWLLFVVNFQDKPGVCTTIKRLAVKIFSAIEHLR